MNNVLTYLLKQDLWCTLVDALTKGYMITGYHDEDDVRITIDYPNYWAYIFTVKDSMWNKAYNNYTRKEKNHNIYILEQPVEN